MYIPIMKTRKEELSVAECLNYCFSDDIIPLFEILDEIYEKKYQVDASGRHLMELKPGNKRKTRVVKERTPGDIITLDKINKIVNQSKVFIDYFRFDIDKYDKQLDISKLTLAYKLNNNSNEYVEKLKAVSRYNNMIPVLSLKKAFGFSIKETIDIINELQKLNIAIALRIEDCIYETYKNIIEKHLRSSDYLLYDINEQDFYSKVMELEDLKSCQTNAKKILLNSPRKLKRQNKEYENCNQTILIDNSVAEQYESYDLYGFGDYGGLKDQLPPNIKGSNGKGAALALLYNYKENTFYSFCNQDTSLGVKGYNNVIKDVIKYEGLLNIDHNCAAYIKVNSMIRCKKSGSWATWNNIALTRYIHQIYLKNQK